MYMILFYCRVDKLNSDRMSDMSDIQAKIGLVGKSASRHLDTLRAQLFRECQTLFELATKPCSVVFDAFREDNYTEGICILSILLTKEVCNGGVARSLLKLGSLEKTVIASLFHCGLHSISPFFVKKTTLHDLLPS